MIFCQPKFLILYDYKIISILFIQFYALFFFYDLSSPSANGFQAKWNLILGLIVMAFGIADSARALSRKKTREARIEANWAS